MFVADEMRRRAALAREKAAESNAHCAEFLHKETLVRIREVIDTKNGEQCKIDLDLYIKSLQDRGLVGEVSSGCMATLTDCLRKDGFFVGRVKDGYLGTIYTEVSW